MNEIGTLLGGIGALLGGIALLVKTVMMVSRMSRVADAAKQAADPHQSKWTVFWRICKGEVWWVLGLVGVMVFFIWTQREVTLAAIAVVSFYNAMILLYMIQITMKLHLWVLGLWED